MLQNNRYLSLNTTQKQMHNFQIHSAIVEVLYEMWVVLVTQFFYKYNHFPTLLVSEYLDDFLQDAKEIILSYD